MDSMPRQEYFFPQKFAIAFFVAVGKTSNGMSRGLFNKRFSVISVPERIEKYGCPFSRYDEVRERQPFAEVI
jgi:hypothetical protein